jgi:hypothetical protein
MSATSKFCTLLVAVVLCARSAYGAIGIELDPRFGSTDSTGVTARLTLEFAEHGDDDILTILVENTTSPKLGSKLTAFGLEIPDFLIVPPQLLAPITPAYFDVLTYDDSKSPAFLDAPGGYDLVFSAEGDFLGGDPQGAPAAGGRESIMLSLGDTGMSRADLEAQFLNFFAGFDGRFAVGRFQVIGSNGEGSDKIGGALISEPASLLLLVVGAAVLIQRGLRR